MAQDLCKYYKMQKFVSYNSGQTWIPLEEYKKGELYEAHSSDCGGGDFLYRWVLVNDGYICDGKDRYTKEVYQYSEDGIVWYNTWPTQYRKATLVERNSPFCDNAGNGQYTSGDTEPISGDTGICPPNYEWNGYECVCTGHIINGECIVCPPHSSWNEQQQQCICGPQYRMRNGVCVYVDPLKSVKCDNSSDGILRKSDVDYYENGWALMSYTIGECITKIGDSAFNGQIMLTGVTIPSTVAEVGILSFANCRSLNTITFPNNITTLGHSAFLQCSSLKSVNFGGTIPSVILNNIFSQCENLQSATWLQYSNVVSIGPYAFNNCYSLSGVVLPNTLEAIYSNAFYSCESLENITIPSGVTSIDASAFANCSGMAFANINSNTIVLGNNVFANCTNLTAVTVQSSAVTMGNNVFNGCTKLLKLTFTATVPPEIEEGYFDNTNECAIFVPCESEQAYKTAWPQYADRISCNDTGIYYRWTDTETRYCDGTDEYLGEKQEMTTDGIHWTDSGQYRATKLITHYSRYCGYQGEVGLTVTNDDGYTRYYEPCE